jgi:hypothetical protein
MKPCIEGCCLSDHDEGELISGCVDTGCDCNTIFLVLSTAHGTDSWSVAAQVQMPPVLER